MRRYFSSLVEQAVNRTAESSLSVLGITNTALRQHLSALMHSECGQESAFLASPVFEQTFGWTPADVTMDDLGASGLLSKELVDALDSKENGRYRFNRKWQPFSHQLTSWNALSVDKKSIVVTSGTGSGKTECFMVPVLDDLYREYAANGKKPLVGVRALFLYPLNALINSQRERLNAWTSSFGEGIRYCLYNGNTEELAKKLRSEQKLKPNEILTRELMREEPASVLVTNGTMLEYMMVRQVDAPIIQVSREQKSLRWIVIDEAHTYIGSQAAELAMQLRRVMQAFGVTPQEVRFVATSATIAGSEATQQLKRFLGNLSGVPEEQIEVIGGCRQVPVLPVSKEQEVDLAALEAMPVLDRRYPEVHPERFDKLLHSPVARVLRDSLVSDSFPKTLDQLTDVVSRKKGMAYKQQTILQWLDICSSTRRSASEPAFIKLRAHFFQKTLQGLWCCFDPDCPSKQGTPLAQDWSLGYVFVQQRHKCLCGAPVFELSFCNDCNEPHLLARDRAGYLHQWDAFRGDEFSLLSESEVDVQEDEDSASSPAVNLVLSPREQASDGYLHMAFDKADGKFKSGGENTVALSVNPENDHCANPRCGYTGPGKGAALRRAILGTPFYVANAVPTVLEYCPDYENEQAGTGIGPNSLPGRGRRLITFTDSRQGTARLAVRMQQEAERNKLRGLVIDVLKERQIEDGGDVPAADTSPEELKEQAAKLKSMGMAEMAASLEAKATALETGRAAETIWVTWSQLVEELKQKTDICTSMLLYNKYQKPEIFSENDGPARLAEMLLFREFMRRPKRQNSLETQGLVQVGYQNLEAAGDVPQLWKEAGLSQQDWQDFLVVCMDFWVRENTFLQIEDVWRTWIGNRFSPKRLLSPQSDEPNEIRIKRWPQLGAKAVTHRLAKLLFLGAKLDPNNTVHRDMVDAWLRGAWLALTMPGGVLSNEGNQFFLRKDRLQFALVRQAWVCPVTNKLIRATFKGLTPYLPTHINFTELTGADLSGFRCELIQMPELLDLDRSQLDYDQGLEEVRKKVSELNSVSELRSRNLWTDINDRAVEGGFYYRTAEHSAQQSSKRLEDYEEMFKKGQINVLNCSTTMEMGVDIGGISAVVMNNVPPHPGNFLQRAGRAGRSNESRALSYTLCKGNPHDLQVFANPLWPYSSIIPAPTVALDSSRLVQRHVNSFLLSEFLNQEIGEVSTERTKLNTHWFFSDEEECGIGNQFKVWLRRISVACDKELKGLVRSTALRGMEPGKLRNETFKAVEALQARWLGEYRWLNNQEQQAKPGSTFQGRLKMEKKRLCEEYLLRYLAARTFLPGYGFPTDVVSFDNFTIEDYKRELKGNAAKEREDNVSRYKGLPSRNLAIAIREYAPGAQIVMDGRVFQSAGVSLHWHKFGGGNEAQQLGVAWRCKHCGSIGYEESLKAGSELVCKNVDCREPIPIGERKQVIEPAGFVTDAYVSVTNDVEHQKFIPVSPPWVSVNADRIFLPNSLLGSMSAGVEGQVFHHSGGEFDTGYALCMKCGRADSMTQNEEYPKDLSPDKNHFAPRPGKEDKNSQGSRIPCDGNVIPGVRLGAVSRTDVFELELRHPVSREYLNEKSQNHQKVAITLAVSLRAALAAILGISPSELGYSTRPVKMPDGVGALVIQLYDQISGGAGFASSAALHIESLLSQMITNLNCKHCETACSECLLDSQTRHDHEKLDRSLALEWLGEKFSHYIKLDEKDILLPGAVYSPGSLEDCIRRHIFSGTSRLSFFLRGNPDEWDLLAPQFKRTVHKYLLEDEVEVDLVLETEDLPEEVKADLHNLHLVGAKVYLDAEVEKHRNYSAQLFSGHAIHTLGSTASEIVVPGSRWHGVGGITVDTDKLPLATFSEVDTAKWIQVNGPYAINVEVTDALNGSLNEFGVKFWDILQESCLELKSVFEGLVISRITYTDRYLQNPAAVALLSSILEPLSVHFLTDCSLSLVTTFKSLKNSGFKAFHDWNVKADHAAFLEKWLQTKLSIPVLCNIHESVKDVAHHRKLVIELTDGVRFSFRLDQGVGYWQLRFQQFSDSNFDFSDSLEYQLNKFALACEEASVQNSINLPTDIVVQYRDK